jgi:hypothetical protein
MTALDGWVYGSSGIKAMLLGERLLGGIFVIISLLVLAWVKQKTINDVKHGARGIAALILKEMVNGASQIGIIRLFINNEFTPYQLLALLSTC